MRFLNFFTCTIFIYFTLTSCEITNQPVELISLTSSDSIARSGDIIVFACMAEDGDRDKLIYDWQSSSGTITSYGDTAEWVAPNISGYYHVSCKVLDDFGSSDAASISIRVVGGIIEGIITNAVNGEQVHNAEVNIGELTTLTDESGHYSFYLSIQSGIYEVNASADSFCMYEGNFEISENYNSNSFIHNLSLSPIPDSGETRLVLNWGAEPYDLDSHLLTPEIDGETYHVYYANRGSSDSVPYVTLDVDDTNGYGPETITIKQSFNGVYSYYIYQYSSTGTLKDSRGIIQIYDGPDCDGVTIQVPSMGEGRYWYVCDVNGETGEIDVINEIQNSEPGI